MWSAAQRNRILWEHQRLQQELPQFKVYHQRDDDSYYAWGDAKTNVGNTYTLWLPIPQSFPDSKPPMYVYAPNPLMGHGYTTINSYGTSHVMHTLANGPSGEVQICHWRESRWHAGIPLDKVLMKGLLWLEAFEQHRQTGRTISEFVRTMAER